MKIDINNKTEQKTVGIDIETLDNGYYLIIDSFNEECIMLYLKLRQEIFFIDRNSKEPSYITKDTNGEYLKRCTMIKKIGQIEW